MQRTRTSVPVSVRACSGGEVKERHRSVARSGAALRRGEAGSESECAPSDCLEGCCLPSAFPLLALCTLRAAVSTATLPQ